MMPDASFPLPSPIVVARRAAWRGILVGLVAGGAVGALGVIVGRWAVGEAALRAFLPEVSWSGWTLLAMVPMAWVVIVVHEAGHLLGGRLGGMRPALLFAGPLQVEFAPAGVRRRLNRHAATWGGLAVALPAPGTSRGAYVRYVAGGPLASLALAALAWVIAEQVGGHGGGILLATALLSTAIGLVTLVPGRAGGYLTDGAQLLGLLRDDAATVQRLRLGAFLSQGLSGVRPRDQDPAEAQALLDEATDPTHRMALQHALADIALDRGDAIEADRWMRALASALAAPEAADVPMMARQPFALRIAAWCARRGDLATARAWQASATGPLFDPAARALTDATLAHADGRIADRDAAIATVRAALPDALDRGGAALMADWVGRLEGEQVRSEGADGQR